MSQKEIQDALDCQLKEAVLNIDNNMLLCDVVREINSDGLCCFAYNARQHGTSKVNKTNIWTEIKKFRKLNHIKLEKSWKPNMIKNLMPKRFESGGRHTQRFKNIMDAVKQNPGIPLTKETLMQFVQRDAHQTNEDIGKLISDFISLPEEERADMVSDDESDVDADDFEAMDSISSIGVHCGCDTHVHLLSNRFDCPKDHAAVVWCVYV
jgi:hypothetical protein